MTTDSLDDYACHILLADDNDYDLLLTSAKLEESALPFVLKMVHDGEDVLDYLQHRAPYEHEPMPDIVLLDINMIRLNGLETLEIIRSMPAFLSLPIFMLTGSNMKREIVQAKTSGANGYIVKDSKFVLQNLIDYAAMARHDNNSWIEVSA